MADFRFVARNRKGNTIRGVLMADSEADARALLNSRELEVVKVQLLSGWMGKIEAWISRLLPISLVELALTTRQFSVMMKAGVGIARALEVLNQQTLSERLSRAWADIALSLQKGINLSRAMARHPDVFEGLYRGLVKAGESSGGLVENLNMLADLLEREVKLRRKIATALTYPVFALVICLAATLLLTQYVLPPLINGVFKDSNMVLPWMTQVVIAATNLLNHRYFFLIFLPGFLLAVYLLRLYSRTAGGRYRMQLLAFHLPVIRVVFIKAACSRFARTMGCLLRCGVPMVHSLQLTDMVLSNHVLSRYIEEMKGGLERGEPLSGLIRAVPLFPPLLAAFTELGEQTGQMPMLYSRLADMFDEELECAIEACTTLLEPMLVAVLGFIVGFVVVAVLLPMYQLLAVL